MAHKIQVSLLDTSFVEVDLLQPVSTKLTLALNGKTSAAINLAAGDGFIPDCTYMRYILITRDGVDLWCGRIDDDAWVDDGNNKAEDAKVYGLDVFGPEYYLDWRTIPRPGSADFDTRTDHADDLAKKYVYYHAGVGAGTGRPWAGLYVQADAHAGTSITKNLVGSTLLQHMIDLATEQAFYWGFVLHTTAGALDGFEFRTAYPLWGVDRHQGNGVVEDLILSRNAGTVSRVAYKGGGAEHRNAIYVNGTGTGQVQKTRTRTNATNIAAWGRREEWLDAGNYSVNADLDALGDGELNKLRPRIYLTATPLPDVLSPSNLGDKVTVATNRYGREIAADAVITGMDIEWDVNGTETITPTMVTL